MHLDDDDLRAAAKAFLAIAPCLERRLIGDAVAALRAELATAPAAERPVIESALRLLQDGGVGGRET